MTWDILNIIGTIAFAISGVLVAEEEDFDIFGIYFLGFTCKPLSFSNKIVSLTQ